MLVEDIMNFPVTTVTPDTPVGEAVNLAKAKGIRHLPVMNGRVMAGIVSDRDLGAKEDATVGQVMSSVVYTVHPLDSIDEAARLLYEHKIGCLPVVRGEELVGIVTETDILRSLVELLGVHKPGSHMEIEMPDRPGMLAEIANIVKVHGVNITSVYTTPAKTPGRKILVLRVQTIDPRRIVAKIKAAGYRVLWPVTRDEENN